MAKLWLLYRVDDNGNCFEMDLFSDERSALQAQFNFESKKHKQAYFVREVSVQSTQMPASTAMNMNKPT